MDSRTQQLLGYPQTSLTTEQISALSQLNEIGSEVASRLTRIAATPNADREWLQHGVQQVQSGLMSLRQAVVPSATFNISLPNDFTNPGTMTRSPR